MAKNNKSKKASAKNDEVLTVRQSLMLWIRDIVIAVIIALLITTVIKPTIVKETSMLPNFHPDDYLFLNKLAYKFGGEFHKGDVIVFQSDELDEKGKKKLLIKRVIGLPGDHIVITDNEVYINDMEDDQSYTNDWATNGEVDVTVPEECLFCMGDNRLSSLDSRSPEIGMVEQERVVGKAVFRLLPFSDFGTFDNPYEKEE